jgi:hypothetical protein
MAQQERRYQEHLQILLSISRKATAQKSWAAIKGDLEELEGAAATEGWYDQLRFPSQFSVFTLSRSVIFGAQTTPGHCRWSPGGFCRLEPRASRWKGFPNPGTGVERAVRWPKQDILA